jgi:hypothetical protein
MLRPVAVNLMGITLMGIKPIAFSGKAGCQIRSAAGPGHFPNDAELAGALFAQIKQGRIERVRQRGTRRC